MKSKVYSLFICAVFIVSCSKDFLEEKPNSDIIIPTTLSDCRKILDNDGVMASLLSALGQLSSDEYYLESKAWQTTESVIERNSYIWKEDIYEATEQVYDWNGSYQAIYYANIVLDALSKITNTPSNMNEWNDIKGSALFFRAFRYYDLVESFTLPYSDSTSDTNLGLPLRSKPEVDEIVQRSSQKATYEFIINDLQQSAQLLSNLKPGKSKFRPSKAAVFALLSRILLNQRKYDKALSYADSCLNNYNELLDYNTVSTTSNNPFGLNNEEVILFGLMKPYLTIQTGIVSPNTQIDSTLYNLYEKNDLRKKIFFNINQEGKVNVKSIYNALFSQPFAGLATDEIYLIKAECLARKDNIAEAMNVLNDLLVKRWRKSTFVPINSTSKENAVSTILAERRKELVFRGTRWSDLRRLNMEGRSIKIKRILNGTEFTLLPNDRKYAFPIPANEVNLSGIEQNPR